MPDLSDEAKQYINSDFARKLEETDPKGLDVLVETKPGMAEQIQGQLPDIPGVQVGGVGIIQDTYIPVIADDDAVSDIASLDGVVLVHQDSPAGVMGMGIQASDIPFLTFESDPIQQAANGFLYNRFAPSDPFGEPVQIGSVEVPHFNFQQFGNPLQAVMRATDEIAGAGLSGEKIVPTAEAVDWIRNSTLTDGAVSGTSKVAVVDTGHTPTEPENGFRVPKLESLVPGEPPLDGMGHGSWCTNMVVGGSAPGVWGRSAGVAPGSVYGHFKALNTFPGFGKTSWILKAMERALDWGADVISMSLGGTQQGPVGEDPQSRFIKRNCKENAGDEDGAIFVVAAGNAGPAGWSVGSPGVAPKALTVASWSLTDEAPAVFSSRGPQGVWYRDNADKLREDLNAHGDELVKPDVAAPGGGRENSVKAEKEDELLFQSSTGWYDGMKDGIKDNRASMKGTSMATPAVAGLVKRLYDAGVVKTAAEVKQVVKERGTVDRYPDAAEGSNEQRRGKNIAIGYGPIREALFDA